LYRSSVQARFSTHSARSFVGRKSSFVIGLRIAAKHANARASAHGGLLLTLVEIALGYTASASSYPPLALTTVNIAADFATVLPRGILNIG
jgi:acyl-coenzyme A thioesterase PaaI-like protein